MRIASPRLWTGRPTSLQPRKPEQSGLWLVVALAAIASGASCRRTEPSVTASRRALNLTPAIGDFAVYGDNSVAIRDRVEITGGDVGVRKRGTSGPFLVPGYELALTSEAKVATTRTVIGNRVLLQDRALVGDVQADQLTSETSTYAALYPLPTTMPQLPPLAEVTPGSTTVQLAMEETRILDPGRYGAVSAAYKSVLRLRGGIYHWASLQLGDEARIEALAPVQIRIAGRVATLARVSVVGGSGTSLTAKDIRIEVSGRNGASGALSDTPVAAAWGNDLTAQAVMLVPNGTLSIGQRAELTGAVGARDVFIDIDSKPTYQSGLGPIQCSPSCDDSNPCTADSCVNGVCSHTPVAAGTSCSDGNACNGDELCDGSGYCQSGTAVVCSASDQCHEVGTCDPATGTCSDPMKPIGTACSDGNACTQTDSCKGGACVGENPVVCTASDQCHNAGTCDPGTGACTNPAKPDKTACNDGNACTQSDACEGGTCVGADPVLCTASDQCHVAGTCDPGTGACSNPGKPDGTACSDGNACTQSDACESGTCVGADPVLCTASDQCHVAGTCDPGTGACSNPAGPDGTGCSDGNACTQSDSCKAGACVGANPVVCVASDQCHSAGTCDPGRGICSNPVKPDGTECSDGNACTQTDACRAGACVGGNPVACTASDQCHVVGSCDPGTGMCSNPARPDGTACDDGDSCTRSDACEAGTCTGGDPVVCTASDQCHLAGTCDKESGLCSNPTKPDGSECSDGNVCTRADSCQAGACVGANPVVCNASDQCHEAGQCDAATGVCSNPSKADGIACNDGSVCTQADTCQNGTCTGSNLVVCTASDQCHLVGTCDPVTGCSNPARPDGSTCNDGNACTRTDTCQTGVCTGGDAVTCAATDQCHEPGMCNPVDGTCGNPAKTNGTACDDGNGCTGTDTCQNGVCAGGSPVVCIAKDQCHTAGACDPTTGLCSEPAKADGTACDDGNACTKTDSCQAGVCAGSNLVVCAPLDQCHLGVCDTASGNCTSPPKPDNSSCDDGVAWTNVDQCISGYCRGEPSTCLQVAQLDLGGVAGAAVWNDGSFWLWGWGWSPRPSRRPGENWASMSMSGGYTACGTKTDGTLWCWGVNDKGQVGDGTVTTRNSFVEVAGGPWAQVSMGASHACAVTQTATLMCWGNNSNGQLGDGTTTQRLSPVPVTGTDWARASGGTTHSCALKSDGTLWCWGLNSSGQLGDGTTTQRVAPVQIAGTNWTSVSTGTNHTCGTRSDGTLWCWGSNAYGELGIGSAGGVKLTPVQVPGAGWVNVSTSYFATCGSKDDGSGYCWGANSEGGLGDGTLTAKSSPTALPGTGWVQVRSSNKTACGRKQDGSLWCWGLNDTGQLGNGSTARSLVPLQIGLSGCLGICGDGRPDWTDQCDDGNLSVNDGCRPDCRREACGDGIVQSQVGVRSIDIIWLGTAVTNGDRESFSISINGATAVSDQGWNAGCWATPRRISITDPAVVSRIANGPNQFVLNSDGRLAWVKARVFGKQPQDVMIFDAGGGNDAESGSRNTCTTGTAPANQWQSVSVEITVAGEDCDDGNTTNGDGCSSTCGRGSCGNHVIDSGEECDDGNLSNNDGCSNN